MSHAAGAQRRAHDRWQQLEAKRVTLANVVPAPTDAERARADRVIEDLTRQIERLYGAFASPHAEASPPASRSEAYFELASFIETTRQRAKEGGVALRPEERFGFSSYRREGPEPAQWERVHRQRLEVQRLLMALLEAKPRSVELVQREDPEVTPRGEGRSRDETDFFVFPTSLALPLPDGFSANAFRVVFVASTHTLRNWLNHLSDLSGPVIVRDVGAEAIRRPVGAQEDPRSAYGEEVRFTVTVWVVRGAPSSLAKADSSLPSALSP